MAPERPGAVVIGGDFQGVGVLRSLGLHGVPTFLVDDEFCIGRFSRHRGRYATCPSPRADDGEALIGFLLALADEHRLHGWMLFPTDDETVEVLSKGKTRLEGAYRVPVPDWPIVRLFAEKRRTHELAERLGIPVPRTLYPGDGVRLDALDLEFPVIVKPVSRDPFYALTRRKAVRADDARELARVWEWASSVVPPSELMVQELIPGGAGALYSLGCDFAEARLQGWVVVRRMRQHPMDFGHATTLAETVDIPELEALGTHLLQGSGYEGLAEVEFMFDRRDGRYKLLEVNPRIWGWHTLAIGAGVDLPFRCYQRAMGHSEAVAETFTTGVKWLRPITDLPTSLGEIAHRRMGLREYLASVRGPKVLAPAPSWDDPAPFVMEYLLIPYLWAKRGF